MAVSRPVKLGPCRLPPELPIPGFRGDRDVVSNHLLDTWPCQKYLQVTIELFEILQPQIHHVA
jgi:hypothetical protein